MKSILFSILGLFSLSAIAAETIDIAASQLRASDTADWLILDVRTPEEYQAGHIPNAINVSHDQIEQNLDVLLPYKDKKLVLYCRSGFRANKAANILADLGFTQLRHLEGDMIGWQKSGLPIEK